MSEFSKDDVLRWLQISLDHNCPMQKAIYYDVFFSDDDMKFTRAYMFFCREMNVKPAQYIADAYEAEYESKKQPRSDEGNV